MGQKSSKVGEKTDLAHEEKLEEHVQINRIASDAVLSGKLERNNGCKRLSLSGLESEMPANLTSEQKVLIRESFEVIKQTVGEIGVVFFMRLFETHPEVQSVFLPFNGLTQEDLKHSSQLLSHGLRVMGFVEKSVARMEQPEKIVTLCMELGRRHKRYKIPHEYLTLIPPQFIYAIKPAMQEKWNRETEEAWMTLFNIILYYMRQAMSSLDVASTEP